MSRLVRIIFAREYLKIARKLSFWVSTLLLPVVFLVLILISGSSQQNFESDIDLSDVKDEKIAIIDQSLTLQDLSAPEDSPFTFATDKDVIIDQVKSGDYDAAFIYPEDVITERTVEVHVNDASLFDRGRYDGLAQSLLAQSVLAELGSPEKIQIASGDITTNTTAYEDGDLAPEPASYLIPGVLGVFFFVLIMLSSNYLILALSEEKENRIIEIIGTIVPPRTLLTGKIAALVALGLTQVLTIGLLGVLVAGVFAEQLPVELAWGDLFSNLPQLLLGLVYVLLGYILLAMIMASVGIVMPSAREAASFSGFFIFVSITPLYFLGALFADPAGLLAVGSSYFPLTAAPVLLIRNALGAIPWWEIPLSIGAFVVYIVLIAKFANFLYRVAGLEYQNRVSLRQLLPFTARRKP